MTYLIWDFDGTLGYRAGGWTQACVEVLEGADDVPVVGRDDVRPYLQSGYPWHTPDEPHTDLSTAEE
jgi:putative hydrolase of the HAD superfamily